MPVNQDMGTRRGRTPSPELGERKQCIAASLLLLVLGPALSCAAALQFQTLEAWDRHIEQAKARMSSRLGEGARFLWVDEAPDRAQRARSGEILVAPVNGIGRIEVPNGLIHDWIGAAFFPHTTIDDIFATTNKYACYKDFFAPTVIDSKLLSRNGNESSFSMRWVKKALFVTTVMDADFRACYLRRSEKAWYGFVWSTRMQDVVNDGQSSELKLPPGTGSGFIWRLFSISRFEERDGGVYVELEAMALSRSVPAYLKWLVNPAISRLSRSSLVTSLSQTREAVQSLLQRAGLDSCGSKTGALRPHSSQ